MTFTWGVHWFVDPSGSHLDLSIPKTAISEWKLKIDHCIIILLLFVFSVSSIFFIMSHKWSLQTSISIRIIHVSISSMVYDFHRLLFVPSVSHKNSWKPPEIAFLAMMTLGAAPSTASKVRSGERIEKRPADGRFSFGNAVAFVDCDMYIYM